MIRFFLRSLALKRARRAYQEALEADRAAKARRDTRDQHWTERRLREATVGLLRAEVL